MVYPNNKNSEGSILHMFMVYEVAYCLQYLITWINLTLISQYMSILLTVSIFFFPREKYWDGQKVYLSFSLISYGKTRTNFLANPTLLYQHSI